MCSVEIRLYAMSHRRPLFQTVEVVDCACFRSQGPTALLRYRWLSSGLSAWIFHCFNFFECTVLVSFPATVIEYCDQHSRRESYGMTSTLVGRSPCLRSGGERSRCVCARVQPALHFSVGSGPTSGPFTQSRWPLAGMLRGPSPGWFWSLSGWQH